MASRPPQTHERTQPNARNRPKWPFYAAILVAGLLIFAVPVGAAVVLDRALSTTEVPELVLPVILIEGVVALLATVALMTVSYQRVRLTDPKAPLGLPEGSVRAIIAVLLILIFAIMALFLYASLLRGRVVTRDLSEGEILALPTESQIVTRSDQPNPDGTFTVQLALPTSEASQDLAKQIVTTVSTLVVAIAAFYFGTQATQAAAGPTRPEEGGPSLAIESPTSPSTRPDPGGSLRISLRATPAGETIRAELVSGDPQGSLTEQSPTQFVYTVGAAAADVVVLGFRLDRYPDQVAHLELRRSHGAAG